MTHTLPRSFDGLAVGQALTTPASVSRSWALGMDESPLTCRTAAAEP